MEYEKSILLLLSFNCILLKYSYKIVINTSMRNFELELIMITLLNPENIIFENKI